MRKAQKSKRHKKCAIKKPKFKDSEKCLAAAQIENKINHLKNNKTDVDSLKEYHKEFIKKQ